jgi:hypothetical protein
MHAEFTIEFAPRGFHVLCEKPLGVDVQECITVSDEVEKAGVVFYPGTQSAETRLAFKFTTDSSPCSTYASSLTSLIHSGRLGRLLNITHLEPIGYYRVAHSRTLSPTFVTLVAVRNGLCPDTFMWSWCRRCRVDAGLVEGSCGEGGNGMGTRWST